MPRTDINEVFDAQGQVIASEQVTVPLIVAGQHRETHQVAVGGATVRVGPAADAPVIAQLPMATPVADTGQRQGATAYVISDLGTGWVAVSKLVSI